MARLSNKMASRILRMGVILTFLAAAAPVVVGQIFPNPVETPANVLSGIYAAAFLFLLSFIAYIFLLYFSYRDTEKRSTELRLRERTKELRSIYEIFDVCRKAHSVGDMIESLPETVCSAMLNPEGCSVFVEYEGKTCGEYPPRNEIKNEFVAPIMIGGARKGQLCAAYTSAEDQIMPEEKQFLSLVAGIFSQTVARIEASGRRAG